MSGTSLDGADIVLVDCDPLKFKLLDLVHIDFQASLKKNLLKIRSQDNFNIQTLIHCEYEIDQVYIKGVKSIIEKNNLDSTQICAIGLHGQTIYHSPIDKFSYQIGQGARIAAMTNIDVVNNFRQKNLAYNGEGAPLVGAFLKHYFYQKSRVFLNIGGIANLYICDKDLSFDTGPGNTLIDSYVQKYFNLEYDKDGDIAKSGVLDTKLLKHLIEHDYFKKKPPKSTGQEEFNLKQYKLSSQSKNVLNSLTEFTAISIANSILEHASTSGEIFIFGGGAYNLFLVQRLKNHLKNYNFQKMHLLGLNENCVEACAFAYLAMLYTNNIKADIKSTTGAVKNGILGALHKKDI